MSAIGDVFVTLRLEGSAFERGVAAAQAQADRLGRTAQTVKPAVANMGDEVTRTGNAAAEASGHFDLGGRSAARFAAIGVQQFIPALEGSRTALEGAYLGLQKMTASMGPLGLVAVGVAGVLAGVLYQRFREIQTGAGGAAEGVHTFEERLKSASDIAAQRADVFARLNKQIHDLEALNAQRGGKDANLLFDIEQHKNELQNRGGKLNESAQRLTTLGVEAIAAEDKANLTSATTQVSDALNEISKVVAAHQRGVAGMLVDDPLQKMLLAERQAADALIQKLEDLKKLDLEGKLTPAIDKLIAGVNAATSLSGDLAVKNFAKTNAPAAAERLGVGGGLIEGFKGIKGLTDDVRTFSLEIGRLAENGVAARDIFEENAKAQAGFDAQLAKLKEQFKDVPSVFNELIELEKKYGNGGLQRTLDAQTRSAQKLKEGTASLEDEQGNLLEKFDGARKGVRQLIEVSEQGTKVIDITNTTLRNTGAAVAMIGSTIDNALIPAVSDMVAGFEVVEGQFNPIIFKVIKLTESMYELARAMNASRIAALAAAGASAGVGTTGLPGPGQ